MTDNFDKFKEFMRLPETNKGDAYYTIGLLRRGKDHPNLPAANYHFRNYYINTLRLYDQVQDEIRLLCRTLQLRAYVSVNRKSFQQVMMNTIAEMSRRAALGDFMRPYAIFENCSGKFHDKNDKYWIVDIDDCPFNTPKGIQMQILFTSLINDCHPEGNRVELVLPTRSGVHLITKPFNRQEFSKICISDPRIENIPVIEKNHITLLFEDL